MVLLDSHVALLERLPLPPTVHDCWTQVQTCKFLDDVAGIWPSWLPPIGQPRALSDFAGLDSRLHAASGYTGACVADEWTAVGAGCSEQSYKAFAFDLWMFWEVLHVGMQADSSLTASQEYFSDTERWLLAKMLKAIEVFCSFCLESMTVGFEERLLKTGSRHPLVEYLQGLLGNMLHFANSARCNVLRIDCVVLNFTALRSCGEVVPVREFGERLDALYTEQGYLLSRVMGTSARKLELPTSESDASSYFPYSLGDVGLESLMRLQEVLTIQRAFIIGNGFGYSTVAVAELWQVPVDAIDPSEHPACKAGLSAVGKIALQRQLNISVHVGWSPADVPKAVQGMYGFAIIDGHHTAVQIEMDFEALLPYLTSRCVVLFDDIWSVSEGIKRILAKHADFTYATYKSPRYRSEQLCIIHRGFGGSQGIFQQGLQAGKQIHSVLS